MKRRLPVSIVVVILILALMIGASPASAQCNAYECRVSVDTAECWIRYGPGAHFFPQASDCRVESNCSWYFEEGQWDVACSYGCKMTECYEI